MPPEKTFSAASGYERRQADEEFCRRCWRRGDCVAGLLSLSGGTPSLASSAPEDLEDCDRCLGASLDLGGGQRRIDEGPKERDHCHHTARGSRGILGACGDTGSVPDRHLLDQLK